MKNRKFLRSVFAFVLAMAMVLPVVPAAHAAGEPVCDVCKRTCSQIVLKEANCHEAGVVENICVNKDCAAYNKSELKKTDIDPNNHDTICVDNGDGVTHTASCRYHSDYKNAKEQHTFSGGYCTKCAAADYSQAEVVMQSAVEIYVDLNDMNAQLDVGKVSIMVGNVDVTKNYVISYSWLDSKGATVGTDQTCRLPMSVTGVAGDYSYGCFVMAMPKEGTAGRYITGSCTVIVHVRDMISASAVVSSGDTSFTLGKTTGAMSASVFQQIYQAVYESSEGYPSYVVFEQNGASTVGQLLASGGKYYFTPGSGQLSLSDVAFAPIGDAAGTYTILFTAYDTKGKEYPGVLTIVVEREMGSLDVAYFVQRGEAITLSSADFIAFWQERNPGGTFKQLYFSKLPAAAEGVFYYNYNPASLSNIVIKETDLFNVVLSSASQYLIDGVAFVPASKYTGLLTVPFEAFGLTATGSFVQETGKLSIFVSSGKVASVKWEMTNGTAKTFADDDLLLAYLAATGSKDSNFSIKLLDVPMNGALYLDYTGTVRDVALTAETVTDYTFYYESELSREIGDLTYVSNKSNKTLTDTLRYLVFDAKGEFVYMGEIVLTCKTAEVVYTKSFTDVKKTDWFYTYVMDLAEAGIINGFEEKVDGVVTYCYKPSNPKNPDDESCQVTYAQALKLIMLAVGYQEQAPTGKHWASGYLAKAQEDELISTVLTEARLDERISRNMIAQIAARAMDLPKSTRTESPLKDVAMSGVYTPYILALYDAGIVNGDENGNYNGTAKINRAEIATIIWRIYNYNA